MIQPCLMLKKRGELYLPYANADRHIGSEMKSKEETEEYIIRELGLTDLDLDDVPSISLSVDMSEREVRHCSMISLKNAIRDAIGDNIVTTGVLTIRYFKGSEVSVYKDEIVVAQMTTNDQYLSEVTDTLWQVDLKAVVAEIIKSNQSEDLTLEECLALLHK